MFRLPAFPRKTTRRPSRARAAIGRVELLENRLLLAAGDDFYVSVGGSDAASGTTPGQAWATLQHAADQVGSGETINVLPGTYQGFDLRTSGTSVNPITFQAQAGVVINQVNPVTNDGINIEQASYVIVDGFTLLSPNNSTRAGIRVVGDGFSNANGFSHHVTLRNNVAANWGRWGIFTGFTDDLLVENNTLSGSIIEHGVYVSNSGDRPVIRDNVIFDNNANGIHMNGDIHTGNTSLPNVDGVIEDAIVRGNIIYGNGQNGGSAINGDGVVDVRIENNLVYDNHASGISLYQIDGGGPSTGGVIVNNTIINASDARWVINLRNGATDATIFNNILYNENGSSVRGTIAALEGSDVGLSSDYNLLDPRFSLSDGSQAMNLSAWRSTTGNDTNSQALNATALDQLFRNFAANDFTLSDSSTARDFGVASFAGEVAPTTDQLGNARPTGSSHDAGAREYQIPGRRQSIAGFQNGQWTVGESDGIQFNNSVWASWTNDRHWQDTAVADVDGDGLEDVIGRLDGEWWVGRSSGTSFETEVWGQWSARATWQDVQVADVDGDGRDDVVGRTNGNWWVARSDGTKFVNELWGVWSRTANWQDVLVADVDGNGRDDIVGRVRGHWWVARSTGNAFVNERWGFWTDRYTWTDVRIGDFNGDGRDDIAGFLRGQWWVARSDTQAFVNERWGFWSNRTNWKDVAVADTDGDGLDDIVGRGEGSWWVLRSQGNVFSNELWGQWSQLAAWKDVQPADVDGDGRFDIVGRVNGNWWVARSTGQSFVNEHWGRWPSSASWDAVHTGYFT